MIVPKLVYWNLNLKMDQEYIVKNIISQFYEINRQLN
jgi:hypothetical protein